MSPVPQIIRADLTLHDMVNELIIEHRHDEPYVPDRQRSGPRFVAHHRVKVPALIDQLLDPDPSSGGGMSGSGAESRPAVRVEALDTIALIADEAGEWIDRLGAVIPAATIVPQAGRQHATLAAVRGSGAKRALVVLRALHAGLSGDEMCGRIHGQRITVSTSQEVEDELGLDSENSLLGITGTSPESDSKNCRLARKVWCCTAHHVEADVRSWWRQARIIAGWDSPAWRPFNTCPMCSKRKGLRVNTLTHTAVCIECRTVWEPTTIGLLAEHIRMENGLDEEELAQLEEGELEETATA